MVHDDSILKLQVNKKSNFDFLSQCSFCSTELIRVVSQKATTLAKMGKSRIDFVHLLEEAQLTPRLYRIWATEEYLPT